jgi:hypothetical protein
MKSNLFKSFPDFFVESKKIDIGKAVEDSFFWVKNEKLRNFFLAYFLVFLIVFCVIFFIVSAAALFFFSALGVIFLVVLIFWIGLSYFILKLVEKDRDTAEFFKEFSKYLGIYVILPGIIGGIGFLFVVFPLVSGFRNLFLLPGAIIFGIMFIIILIALINFSYLSSFYLYSKIGKNFGKKSVFEKFSIANVFEAFKFWIVISVTSLFNWINNKILIAQAILAVIILFLLLFFAREFTGLTALTIILAIILGIVYFIIVCYNIIRLSMAVLIRIFKNKSATESLKESWELTRGNALYIFLSELVIFIISFVIGFIIGIVEFVASLVVAIVLAVAMGGLYSITPFLNIARIAFSPLEIFSYAISIFIGMSLLFSIYSQLEKDFKFPSHEAK